MKISQLRPVTSSPTSCCTDVDKLGFFRHVGVSNSITKSGDYWRKGIRSALKKSSIAGKVCEGYDARVVVLDLH